MPAISPFLLARGMQGTQPTAQGLLGGVEALKNMRSRNSLLDLAVQNAPAEQERVAAQEKRAATKFDQGQEDRFKIEMLRVSNDFVNIFDEGGKEAALPYLANLTSGSKEVLQIRDEAIEALNSPDPQDDINVLAQARGLQQSLLGEGGSANAQFGTSRSVVATTASGKKLNGIMVDVRDPNSGETRTEFKPDVGQLDPGDPIVSTSNVGRMGITGDEQNEALRLRQTELERLKTEESQKRGQQSAKTTRLTGFADTGLTAAQAHTTTKRSLALLNEIKTGGFEGVALKARQLFGIQSETEAELTTGMLRVVLAQLRPVFGAAFTKAEGDSLKAIEANIGKSTEGNKRLLTQLLKMQERSVKRGISAARQINDNFTADEIQAEFDFNLSGNTPTTGSSGDELPEGTVIRLSNGQLQKVENGELVNIDD